MYVDSKTLYEKQRTKVTNDISKLKVNRKELEEILGGVKLKSWVLISPQIAHRNLINHCNDKRDLVKSWKLPFIDDDFEVLVHEAEDYALEIGEYFNFLGKKMSLSPSKDDTSDEKLVQWRNTEIDLVQNAIEKNEVRIKSLHNNGVESKVNWLTNETVKYYLNGESMLRKWAATQPDNHQRFTELLASVEDELRERCLLNVVEPNKFVSEISGYIESKIRTSFAHLDESSIVRLKNYSISFWLLRCPLYFEVTNEE